MSITDMTEARTKFSEFLLPGRVVGTQGRKFLITGVISGVNYSATEVKDGALAGNYKLKRQASYLDFGMDEALLTRHEEAVGGALSMGDVVEFTEGRFKGEKGIVGQLRTGKYLIAIPGKPSVLTSSHAPGVKKINATLV